MTDVAKKDYKDSLKQKAEHLIIKGFPEKIVKLNELLETSNFQNRDLADVHQDLNIPVPPPASAAIEPNAKRQRMDSSEVSSNSSEGTRVYALPNGTVPCNKPLSDLIHLVKPHIRELVEDSNLKREKARLEKIKGRSGPSTSQQQREESYRQWLERKRTQTERSRAEEIMRQYRRNEQMERERHKRERAKEEKLADWLRRKEEEMKAMKTREERRAARTAIDEERRRANGERAYRDWLRTSKNKPLPVPLNQGELSMRGSVSQMYINPIPWQSPQ